MLPQAAKTGMSKSEPTSTVVIFAMMTAGNAKLMTYFSAKTISVGGTVTRDPIAQHTRNVATTMKITLRT
jgi:hypothetical protein